jgi:hypothetical protein
VTGGEFEPADRTARGRRIADRFDVPRRKSAATARQSHRTEQSALLPGGGSVGGGEAIPYVAG